MKHLRAGSITKEALRRKKWCGVVRENSLINISYMKKSETVIKEKH
jgi:hypothetical protein